MCLFQNLCQFVHFDAKLSFYKRMIRNVSVFKPNASIWLTNWLMLPGKTTIRHDGICYRFLDLHLSLLCVCECKGSKKIRHGQIYCVVVLLFSATICKKVIFFLHISKKSSNFAPDLFKNSFMFKNY